MRKRKYKYQVGEVVNETLRIVSQTTKGKRNDKAYEVQSITYPKAPTYITTEYDLKRGKRDGYIKGYRVFEGNSLWGLKHLRKYIIDTDLAKRVTPNSNKKSTFKCSHCNYKKEMFIYNFTRKGISCPYCDRGTSYPELFMMAYLEVKGIKYEYQKVFKDLPNRRFDFYLPESNTVIETHGEQHYKKYNKNSSWSNSYGKTIKSDKLKKEYCNSKCITYTEIDCRESSFSYIFNSINLSNLESIVREEEIEKILSIIENNKIYPVKEIINLYQEGYNSPYIARLYKVDSGTVRNILRRNNVNIRTQAKSMSKKTKCLTTNEVFESVTQACNKFNLSKGNVAKASKGERAYAGKHPITGEKLRWEYVD